MALWVSEGLQGTVARIDPATNRVVAEIAVGATPVDSESIAGDVWVPNLRSNNVSLSDPATNSVKQRFGVGSGPFVIASGLGDAWSTSFVGHTVWRVRPSG